MPWIIGYTVWNWAFVYLNLGFQGSILHVAVLGSALIVAFIKKERWLQARAATLGMYFIVFHSWPHLNRQLLIDGSSEPFGLIVALVSLGFMFACAILFMRRTWRAMFQP